MPQGVAIDDMADLLNSTYQWIKKRELIQIAQLQQDYPMMRMLFDEKNIKFRSGRSIRDNFKRTTTGNARHVQPFQKGTVAQQDNTANQDVPWRRTQTSSVYDRYIDMMNTGDEELFDLVAERDMDMDLDMCQLVENTIWGKPADSSDEVTPWGVQMYVVPNATKGFNGGNPSGFSSVAGVDRTVAANANLLNYTTTYTDFSGAEGGVIEELIEMADKTKFTAPWPSTKSIGVPDVPKRAYFANYSTTRQLKKLLKAQNENLGSDLDPFADGAKIRKVPVIWAPQLDDATIAPSQTNPIYQLDWNCFHPVVFSGAYFYRHPATKHPEQPNTLVVFKDLMWNMRGRDYRRMGIAYQAA